MRPAVATRTPAPGRLAILGAILALHLVVFAWLGLTSVARLSASSDPSPFVIELQPRSAGPPSPQPDLALTPPRVPADAPFRPRATFPVSPIPDLSPGITPAPSPRAIAPEPPLPLQGAAIARSLRNSALGCRLGGAGPAEQDRCDRILAEAAARAGPIRGTGHPTRDARFAAEGAEQLARYEDKRKPLKPYSRAEPCPGSPSPSEDCAVAIQGRIWSSQDGWLPDLTRPH